MSRTMLITGTRKGVGRALAEHYLQHGWTVVGCSRQPTDLHHHRYVHHIVDIANEADVGRMFTGVKCLDVLINNAGIASMNHMLLTPAFKVKDILDVNVTGTFLACRKAARVMINAKSGGRIINFSTIAVPWRLAGESAYVASKAAVEALTRVMVRELIPYHITINAVGLTLFDSDLIKHVLREKIDKMLQRLPVKRMCTVEDVVNVIDFYVQPASNIITGQVIYLGGVS